jgi:hypothetical protein
MTEVERLVKLLQDERVNLAKLDKDLDKPKLPKAPSAAALAKAVQAMPVPPPPPYHEFLSKHNGWERFWDHFDLVGVSGQQTEKNLEDITVSVREDVAALKPPRGADVRAWATQKEESDAEFLYLPNHLILGTDRNGQILLFDRRTRDADGNMEVVLWSHDGGIVERHPGFLELLEAALNDTRAKVKELDNPRPAAGDDAAAAKRKAFLAALRSSVKEVYAEEVAARKKRPKPPPKS